MSDHIEEHDHEHTHTYSHAHPHVHAGEDGHTHTHPEEDLAHHHEHHHEHPHSSGKPVEELYALMKYMAGHNASHTRELEHLAGEVRDAGNSEAYDHIMEAVRFFDEGNTALAKALEHFPAPKV